MKRLFGLSVALFLGVVAWAQEADTSGLERPLAPTELARRRHYLDSISRLPEFTLTHPTLGVAPFAQPRAPQPPRQQSVRVVHHGFPPRVYVLNNISLQIGGYVNLTNGQAWLFSPYPNGYLDARTLSLPLPR